MFVWVFPVLLKLASHLTYPNHNFVLFVVLNFLNSMALLLTSYNLPFPSYENFNFQTDVQSKRRRPLSSGGLNMQIRRIRYKPWLAQVRNVRMEHSSTEHASKQRKQNGLNTFSAS